MTSRLLSTAPPVGRVSHPHDQAPGRVHMSAHMGCIAWPGNAAACCGAELHTGALVAPYVSTARVTPVGGGLPGRARAPAVEAPRAYVGLHVAATALSVVWAVGGNRPPKVQRVDESSGVGQAASPGPRRTGLARRPGLVEMRDRLGEHAGPEKGDLTGPNPVDRGKYGSKIHLITERTGLPLSVGISGANVHDSQALIPLVKGIPPVRSRRGPRRRKPGELHADKGYDYNHLRRWLSHRGSSTAHTTATTTARRIRRRTVSPPRGARAGSRSAAGS